MAKVSKAFLRGYSNALNLFAAKKQASAYSEKNKDYNALRSDWENVGNSIRRETGNFKARNT